jgi:hypothetical protein
MSIPRTAGGQEYCQPIPLTLRTTSFVAEGEVLAAGALGWVPVSLAAGAAGVTAPSGSPQPANAINER